MTTQIDECHVVQLTAPSGLLIDASIANNRVLEEFYRDYDAAFILANEKEGYAGFAECLELNSGEAYEKLTQRYGIFREFVIVVYDPETKARIGGANFIAFPLKTLNEIDRPFLSINLNYIFINPDQRKRGYFKQVIKDLPELAFRLLLATNQLDMPKIWRADDFHEPVELPQTLVFLEQNDPFVMSAEDYKLDTAHSGLDQLDRIAIWTGLGAKIVDFPYVQPPLTDTQSAAHDLVLAVIGMEADTLDPHLLHQHLERFFGISVLKGTDVARNASAAKQLALLTHASEQGKPLRLLSGESLAKSADANTGVRPASLRDALRS
ncbi:MAG: hypothetical protein V4628_18210 [Pseudomonadota bacterium]